MDIDPIRTHLLALAEREGVSLAALSRMIGRNGTYLQQFIRKGSPRKLEETDRGKLARFFDVDESELGGAEEKSHQSASVNRRSQWVEIPRIAIEASAGPGANVTDEIRIGSLPFSAEWLEEMGLRARSLSSLSVRGDSMEPTLRHGDEILVDTAVRNARDGIWVVRLGGGVLVKRLGTTVPGVVTLLSDNFAYPPVECRMEDVSVIGKVVWKGGRL